MPSLFPEICLRRAHSRCNEVELVAEGCEVSVSDPIADMLTKIRNASEAKFEKVDITTSKLKLEIVKIRASNRYGSMQINTICQFFFTPGMTNMMHQKC